MKWNVLQFNNLAVLRQDNSKATYIVLSQNLLLALVAMSIDLLNPTRKITYLIKNHFYLSYCLYLIGKGGGFS